MVRRDDRDSVTEDEAEGSPAQQVRGGDVDQVGTESAQLASGLERKAERDAVLVATRRRDRSHSDVAAHVRLDTTFRLRPEDEHLYATVL